MISTVVPPITLVGAIPRTASEGSVAAQVDGRSIGMFGVGVSND